MTATFNLMAQLFREQVRAEAPFFIALAAPDGVFTLTYHDGAMWVRHTRLYDPQHRTKEQHG